MIKGTDGMIKPTLVALMVATALVGCGEGGSSSAGAGYGQVDTGTGGDTGGGNSGGDNSGGDNSGGSDGGGDNSGGTTFNETQLLVDITDNVLVPTYQSFQSATQSQKQSVADYCTAVVADATNSSAQQLAAQQDWKLVAGIWQQAEMMQIGPLVSNNYALRNTIYSWPVVSRCGVDQDVIYAQNGSINGSPYDLAQRTDTRRGIDALEHLLFSTNLDHNCNSNIEIVSDWNARSESERMIARCQFAVMVADDLALNATTLVNSWTGTSGYAAVLKAAGDAGNEYETSLKGINAISDGMFYLDSVTKDNKLAKPVGILDNNCGGGICPEHLESTLSGQSVEHIINNLEGFSKVFYASSTGAADEHTVGFDDFLIDVGDSDTATNMGQALMAAKSLAESLNMPLSQLLTEDPEQVEALHSEVKAVTDKLKTDFITSLALELPQTSAGDND